MTQRVLVTGATGFTGRHLVERLRERGPVFLGGIGRRPRTDLPLDAYYPVDITDPETIDRVVAEFRPETVYHLAGLSGQSALTSVERTNVAGFLHLRQALARHAGSDTIRLLTIGSAAEVGSKATLPVSEGVDCTPESDYGRSKAEVTRLALAEPTDGPVAITVARTFNLVGPGMDARLSLGNFARQIAAARRGQVERIECGGRLDSRRDFVDVRDAVDAYIELAERGQPGELYNVCSGQSHALGELLATLQHIAGTELPVMVDSGPRRPGDLDDIYGTPEKIAHGIGWRVTIPLRRSLEDLLHSVEAA